MLGLLLTEKDSSGGNIPLSTHAIVELLIENYVVKLSHTLNSILYQQERVKSRQDMAEFSMQINRNRILKLNLQIGIAAVSLGICASVFGLFGMNVDLPKVLIIFLFLHVAITNTLFLLVAFIEYDND